MSRDEAQPVPLFDLKAQWREIGDEVKKAVAETLDSTQYIWGPKLEGLEQDIASFVGAPRAVGVSSGTDALLAALMALDIGPGDRVVTTPYSFFATAGVIGRLHAQPVFIDIDPETYNIDPAGVREWFETHPEERKSVKAILPVHLYGQCADMGAILDIAREFDVAVVEDAAQALGATCPLKDGKQYAGAIGDLGCYSFYPTKNLGAVGEGGMVAGANEDLLDKIALLRHHGQTGAYTHALLGGNFRLDAIQAAALRVKFQYLPEWNNKRRAIAERYDKELKGLPLRTPAIAWGREHHIYHQYVIEVNERRDELRSFLSERKIGAAIFYPLPFHMQECFRHFGYSEGDFPRAEHAAKHTLALPIFPELSIEMHDIALKAIREFFGQ